MSKIKLIPNKKFGYFLCIIFLFLIIYFNFIDKIFLAILCSFFLLIIFFVTIFASSYLTPLNKLWMQLGFILSKIINPIILGFIFFILITPVGFIRRKLGNDELKIYKKRNSLWNKRKKNNYNYDFFKKPF